MGQLVNGVWHNVWYDTKSTGGRFVRTVTAFRNRIAPNSKFTPEAGRYHLYVSLACPWAHRTLVVGTLKGLLGKSVLNSLTPTTDQSDAIIPVHVVNPLMLENGWTFNKDFPGVTGDPVYHKDFMYQMYTTADPEFTGRVTVPVLWDTKEKTIVNNESQEICEIFDSSFDDLPGVAKGKTFLPKVTEEQKELDEFIYHKINNGVYKSGFATSQEAYNENVYPLFDALDKIEERLSKQRYLLGNELTLSDIKLWTTLVRFDHVYTTHFKCDKKSLHADYPNLSGYLRDIYQTGNIRDTVSLPHIRNHYFRSHPTINPYGIISIGPDVDWNAPPKREHLA